MAVPEIFLLSAGALAQTRSMVAGLHVDPERMRKNLDLTRGLIASEAVMMGLGPALGRQRAQCLVYDVCRRTIATGGSFVGALAGEEEISSHIGRDELAKLA